MPAATLELFGLKNCDSCRRALRWCRAQGLECVFRDIRVAPHTAAALSLIAAADDWTPFLNRRSATWRALPDADKSDLDKPAALRLMAAQPTLIKRPLLRVGNVTLAGFEPARVAGLVG